MAQKPLMLKDYLELDSCSESFWWAPLQRAGGTTVRSLLETELGGCAAENGGWRMIRSRSKGALTRLSAVLKLLQFSAGDAPAPSSDTAAAGGHPRLLSRSFSKKLRRGFWKKRGYEKEGAKVMVKDIVRLKSLDEETVERGSLFYPSTVVSRCSSSSDFLFFPASSDLFVDGKESLPISPKSDNGIFLGAGEESRRPSTVSQDPEEICGKVGMDCPFEEEKEQLSPVSVMDFPYQDEDEDEAVVEQPLANSISFEQSIVNIERTKNQLLEKIRRFESLANLDPVDLDHRFACTKAHAETIHVETDEDEEGYRKETPRRRTASALLRRLTDIDSLPVYGEKLLFDFFVEGLSFAEDFRRGTKSGFAGDEGLLQLANHWVAGSGIAAEHGGEVVAMEMERCGGGWKNFEEEEEIWAAEMTGGVLTWLMEELVDDLLVSVA